MALSLALPVLPDMQTPLPKCVPHIVGVSTAEQVGRIHASRVIATMTNLWGKWQSVGNFPNHAGSNSRFSTPVKPAVTSPHCPPEPGPTRIWPAGAIHLRPESLNILRGGGWVASGANSFTGYGAIARAIASFPRQGNNVQRSANFTAMAFLMPLPALLGAGLCSTPLGTESLPSLFRREGFSTKLTSSIVAGIFRLHSDLQCLVPRRGCDSIARHLHAFPNSTKNLITTPILEKQK